MVKDYNIVYVYSESGEKLIADLYMTSYTHNSNISESAIALYIGMTQVPPLSNTNFNPVSYGILINYRQILTQY